MFAAGGGESCFVTANGCQSELPITSERYLLLLFALLPCSGLVHSVRKSEDEGGIQ